MEESLILGNLSTHLLVIGDSKSVTKAIILALKVFLLWILHFIQINYYLPFSFLMIDDSLNTIDLDLSSLTCQLPLGQIFIFQIVDDDIQQRSREI